MTGSFFAISHSAKRSGRLSDIIGRKAAMLLGLSLFGEHFPFILITLSYNVPGSGTILCGLAQSMGQLVAARSLAGMGGGG